MEAGCRKMSKVFSAGRGKSCPFPVSQRSMTIECNRYAAFTDNIFSLLKHNCISKLQILLLDTCLGEVRAHISSVVQTV